MSHRYLWNPQAVDQLFSDEQIHYDSQQSEYITDDLLWALTDNLNSIRDLATYDPGSDETTIATHRIFDAFGNKTSESGAEECLFGYTGKLFDDATKLQNNCHRWYEAITALWISQDWKRDDNNLYCYCGNGPLNHIDPEGFVACPGGKLTITRWR